MVTQPLEDLLIYGIQDLYDAQLRLAKKLPEMAKAASLRELKQAFADYLAHTETYAKRLEHLFSHLNQKAKRGFCEAVQGLIEEVAQVLADGANAVAVDAELIGIIRRVEHYDMAICDNMRNVANQLNYREVADIIQGILDEKVQISATLSRIANLVETRAMIAQDLKKT